VLVLQEQIEFIHSEVRTRDEKIATVQAAMDEQDKKVEEVFKQNDLTLCIRKYFYMFEVFTDS
jgi:hypothetical protein